MSITPKYSDVNAKRDDILDLLRGMSALAVLVGHTRNFFLLDYAQITTPGPITQLFYLLTGLHHQAVIIFFVLSGYFVGGTVITSMRAKRFSWSQYTQARMTRLWVVLIPALILTLLFDTLGRYWNPSAYEGAYREIFVQGPSIDVPASLDFLTFFGNVLFLQTIKVPVFGSNGPLWSLAYEFWYYLLFPLLAGSLWASNVPPYRRVIFFKTCNALLFCALIFFLPTGLLMSGLVWLLGVVVWWLGHNTVLCMRLRHWTYRYLGGGLFLCAIVATKIYQVSDFFVGIAFAIWLPSLLGPWSQYRTWHKISTFFSDISYTLYLVHFPMLFFIASVVFRAEQSLPNARGLTICAVTAIGCILLSVLMWWLFESRTAQVRQFFKRNKSQAG